MNKEINKIEKEVLRIKIIGAIFCQVNIIKLFSHDNPLRISGYQK